MIQVDQLSKTYGDVNAVDRISFAVAAGEIFAFLGPNGAGKTTTIQMLTTLVNPTSGSIRIDGQDPRVNPHASRNQLWTHVKHLNDTEGVTVFLTTHDMDEAERVAHRIGVIDHGKIVAQGTAEELKQQTKADSLEGAFLALTGSTIRDERAGQGSYLQFVAPGVIGMSVLFSSIFSGIGLLWDRQFGFLKETLVAPVPRLHIMIGRTLGGATVSTALVYMALICIVFAALGTVIGSTLQNMQGFQLIMNFLVMPIFFLPGALFPPQNLPPALTVATRIDPLTYGIDGLRSSLIGISHFTTATNLGVLI